MNFQEKINALEIMFLKEIASSPDPVSALPKLLSELDFSNFSRKEVIPFFQETLPRQHYAPNSFGRFNLTLKWNDHFSIQLYFMEDIATEIHAHSFNGYFYYLEGRVLESTFERLSGSEILPGVYENGIQLKEEKILYPFEGRRIKPGPIHQVLRIDTMSTVLMIMMHEREVIPDNLILPSGHIIEGQKVSDKFQRLINLLETVPELASETLSLIEPRELLLYLFRNGEIKSYKSQQSKDVLLQELKKYIDVDKIIEAYDNLTKKHNKLKLIGEST